MNRDEALDLIKSKIKDDKLIKHMLAVEACMLNLAEYFGKDKEKWTLAGLLHDIDYEDTKDNPEEHGLRGIEYLKSFDITDDILQAIKVHVGHDVAKNKMETSLLASDALSGLIVACALVHPEGLSGLSTEFIMKKFKEKQFARGADRENIKKCERMNLTINEFISICLSGMKSIANDLSL